MAVRARQGIFYECCKTWNCLCRLFEINVREVFMFAIFLTILVVGLIITFAGFFLSPSRTQVPTPRGMAYTEYGPRIRRASANIHRQPRTRRFPLEIEPRGWTNIVASINTDSIMNILGRRRA